MTNFTDFVGATDTVTDTFTFSASEKAAIAAETRGLTPAFDPARGTDFGHEASQGANTGIWCATATTTIPMVEATAIGHQASESGHTGFWCMTTATGPTPYVDDTAQAAGPIGTFSFASCVVEGASSKAGTGIVPICGWIDPDADGAGNLDHQASDPGGSMTTCIPGVCIADGDVAQQASEGAATGVWCMTGTIPMTPAAT